MTPVQSWTSWLLKRYLWCFLIDYFWSEASIWTCLFFTHNLTVWRFLPYIIQNKGFRTFTVMSRIRISHSDVFCLISFRIKDIELSQWCQNYSVLNLFMFDACSVTQSVIHRGNLSTFWLKLYTKKTYFWFFQHL